MESCDPEPSLIKPISWRVIHITHRLTDFEKMQ